MALRTSPKRWKSQAAKALLDRAPHSVSVEQAVKVEIMDLMYGIQCPPTDLNSLSNRLNVESIRFENIPIAGYTELVDGKFKICCAQDPQESRQRFTVAHELAHVFLHAQTSTNLSHSSEEIERLCNLIGTEFLIPSDVFLRCIPDIPSVDNLIDTANKFQTSLQATAIRYCASFEATAFVANSEKVHWTTGYHKVTINQSNIREAILEILEHGSIHQVLRLAYYGVECDWMIDGRKLSKNTVCCFLTRIV